MYHAADWLADSQLVGDGRERSAGICRDSLSCCKFSFSSPITFGACCSSSTPEMAAIVYWHMDSRPGVSSVELSTVRALPGSTVAENLICEADCVKKKKKTESHPCIVLLIDTGNR